MKYQLAIYDPSSEHWRHVRADGGLLLMFDTLEEAETEAKKQSLYIGTGASTWPREVLVITIHCGFATHTEYPPREPVRTTKRFVPGAAVIA